jgi:hypothetical protein
MHESDRGCQVSAVGFSHDANFFFSSGFDGSIFMYKIALPNKTSAQSITAKCSAVQNEVWMT